MKKLIQLLHVVAFVALALSVRAAEMEPALDSLSMSVKANTPEVAERHFLPMHRRINREIDKNRFVYKGEVLMGITASYGTLTSDNSDMLLILEQIDAKGAMATVKPYIGFAYSDNHVLGIRFGYTHMDGSLGNLGLNLGEQNDLSFSLGDMGFKSSNFQVGIYHRSYVGLDRRGRFGLFADLEAAISTGSSSFEYLSGEEPKLNDSHNLKAELSFNPGVAVYLFPNVCATLSFGLGGLQYTKITQKDAAGEVVGSREASKLQFRLNLAQINIGFTFHLWNKKKE